MLDAEHKQRMCDDIRWNREETEQKLTDIMRQKGDLEFAEMLSRLRTADDIEILKSKLISRTDVHYPTTALHIFLTRADVDMH
ncbi:hypothetical protein KUTeg_008589 [Tegillarca granosa]|uniref:Uncharacterized protein n=1 Tax=Tegillarca granosa TaxID=220873 RepID=A0ABQ9F9J6_TEGGR|nr:hypothetical protein KUTeg_008589 [Tegillarca granosa]